MVRVLVIEVLLSVIFGAVVLRLVWTASRSLLLGWAAVLALCAVVLLFLPGHIDQTLIAEYGRWRPCAYTLSPFAVNLLRCAGVLLGACAAWLAIRARRRIGLEDSPPYEDFP